MFQILRVVCNYLITTIAPPYNMGFYEYIEHYNFLKGWTITFSNFGFALKVVFVNIPEKFMQDAR